MKRFILAHDLGTTGNKATLYDAEGRLIGSAFYPYDTEYARDGWAEQNPDDWWRAVCASTCALIEQSRVAREEIACIVFSGQMNGCVAVDRHGRPLRKAIIWADQRAVEQVDWLAGRIPPEEVYAITGHRLSPSYSLPKILWLREQEPEVYRAAHKFLQAKDSVVARLTGAFVTDRSDASAMNLYDLKQGAWSQRILDAAQLDPCKLMDVRASTVVVGEVTQRAAEECGLAAGTPVVIGGGDGVCASVGAGVVAQGSAYNYVGSSSWIALATEQPIFDPQFKTFTFCHMVPGMYMPTGTTQSAGAAYQWARDQLCRSEKLDAAAIGRSAYPVMDDEARLSPPGANGLLFLPYLMGERTPHWNPRARGGFIGLTIRHTRADMLRAVLEGVAFNLKWILDIFLAQGAQIDAMRLIGGGARARFWNQIMAGVYGIPVQRLTILEEATSMGAALAGGVAVGLYPDFSMAERMNPVQETIDPDPAARQAYAQLYPLFQEAYRSLEPTFDKM